MYMCRETLRRAVVQKFTDYWNNNSVGTGPRACPDGTDGLKSGQPQGAAPTNTIPKPTKIPTTFEELQETLDYKDSDVRREANEIINSLKVCDPAVGSGHFLVSALNEIIAIKSELNVLSFRDGKRVRGYAVSVENDELTVYDEEEDELFRYRVGSNNKPQSELQKLQEMLFHEKQTIIEHCLFGVDINPNSVKICRLRLWIELLKSAYYKTESSGHPQGMPLQLETLPNIDINIKCGNSLISKYGLDITLSAALKGKFSVSEYRDAVHRYQNAESKSEKREMEELIKSIKRNFATVVDSNGPEKKRQIKLAFELSQLEGQGDFLADTGLLSKKESAAKNKRIAQLKKELAKVNGEIETIEKSVIYSNAFEWRFEFPEVLSDSGEFIGFDAVIGNPPYMSAMELKKGISDQAYKKLKDTYSVAKGTIDLFIYFFELSQTLIRRDGYLSFITPNRYLSADYGTAVRELLISKMTFIKISDFSSVNVFEEASTYPVITFLKNAETKSYTFLSRVYRTALSYKEISFPSNKLTMLSGNILGFLTNEHTNIVNGIIEKSVPLTLVGEINATSTAGEADEYHNHINETSGFKLINTGTIDPYINTWGQVKLIDKGCKYLQPHLPQSPDVLGVNRYNLYSSKKIIFAKIALKTEAYLDEYGEYASINTNCIHTFNEDYDPYYVLGWVNSKLFQFIFEAFFHGLRMAGGYLPYTAPNLRNMYIFSATRSQQQLITDQVRVILSHKKENPLSDTSAEENQIDELVFDLYGLTDEEKAIVRGGEE